MLWTSGGKAAGALLRGIGISLTSDRLPTVCGNGVKKQRPNSNFDHLSISTVKCALLGEPAGVSERCPGNGAAQAERRHHHLPSITETS